MILGLSHAIFFCFSFHCHSRKIFLMIYQYCSHELNLYHAFIFSQGTDYFCFQQRHKITVLTRITMNSVLGTAQITVHRMGTGHYLAFTQRLRLRIMYWVLDIMCHVLSNQGHNLPCFSHCHGEWQQHSSALVRCFFCRVCQSCFMRLHLE